MSLLFEEYSPALPLRSGHFGTVYPTLFRTVKRPDYVRQRIATRDGDFVDVDGIFKANRRLAIICHGLEGDSDSKYAKGTTYILSSSQWDTIVLNYRGCSGVVNNKVEFYHSGATNDLQDVIDHYIDDYDEIMLVGYSLGGNLVLKYCGERSKNIHNKIKGVAAFSVPLDLGKSSIQINKLSNYIYEQRFLISLKHKVVEKAKHFPEAFNLDELNKVKSVYDFDEVITSKIHGFGTAENYYYQCSSIRFVSAISIPTLICNAQNDPFLPEECYPYELMSNNDNITFLTPKYGGHVGFGDYNTTYYWSEKVIRDFFDYHSAIS